MKVRCQPQIYALDTLLQGAWLLHAHQPMEQTRVRSQHSRSTSDSAQHASSNVPETLS